MLYVISTPIGNLEDMTIRAVSMLKSCDFIIAENPGNSGKLLKRYEIPPKKTYQFAEHNEQKMLPILTAELKMKNGCLITDAGSPGVSDPGFRLVRSCVKEQIPVVPIPGPSAVTAALMASGLPTDRFWFVGFLPRTPIKILNVVKTAQETESTLIGFESPHRIQKTVQTIAGKYPESKIVIARELTKIHEEFLRGSAAEVNRILGVQKQVKGEVTILVSFKG